jgi:hypothetical protein
MSNVIEGYNKDTLLAMLQSRVVEIKFRKADGDLRVLRGTLQEDIVPKTLRTLVASREEEYPNIVTVWDLDAPGWRSIRTDRIIEVL